jgi:hypothetical protein
MLYIEQQIADKQQQLLNKKSSLDEKIGTNKFLLGVKTDYQKYYDFIIKEKQSQIDALNALTAYVYKLHENDKTAEGDNKMVMQDQEEILQELTKVKSALDKIVNDTKL